MLNANDRVIVDGVPVPIGPEIAAHFRTGDQLFGVNGFRLLHVPAKVNERVSDAVNRASGAFEALQVCHHDQVTAFFTSFAEALQDKTVLERIRDANAVDITHAHARGRSTTRLALSDGMLSAMIDALHLWSEVPDRPNASVDTVVHDGWTVEVVRAPLGVVAFVFEGRPNVFSDATGVLRTGNTCVFRIGSDALHTARAIMDYAVRPSLVQAGLPIDSIVLIDDESHASAWSLFAQRNVALAVARGSGSAVSDLGAVARQSGIPFSLHGTGGAWMVVCDDVAVADSADATV
jgi:glutamate-5-semialdehyde dehydrogenase